MDYRNRGNCTRRHRYTERGENFLNFEIKDCSRLRFNHIPELVLTLGGSGKARSKVTVDLDTAISVHRLKARLLQNQEEEHLLKKMDGALNMPIDSDEDKESKKVELASILLQAQNLLSSLKEDLAVLDRDVTDKAQLNRRAALSSDVLISKKHEKRERCNRLIEKIKKINSQSNALESGDTEVTKVLVHEPSSNLGMVPEQGTSSRKAIEQTVIGALQKKEEDPDLTDKFGADKWKKYFGEVGPEPTIPEHISARLNQPCKLFPGEKVHETHLLTLIPATVNGEPLTLNSFQKLSENPKEAGYQGKYYRHFYNDPVKQEFGDKTSGKSYWVLMTRDVIPDSREKEYVDQIQFVQHTAKHLLIPYTLPSILEGVVSTMCYHTETGKNSPGL